MSEEESFAVPSPCNDWVTHPVKRTLSLSLGNKGKKAKLTKLEAYHNTREGIESAKSSITSKAVSCNLSGLTNVTNSCYANAVTQALRFCPRFSLGLSQIQLDSDNGLAVITLTLQELFQLMNRADANGGPVKTNDLMNTLGRVFPQFTSGEQHDAQELLKCLLTALKDPRENADSSNVEERHGSHPDAQSPQRLPKENEPLRAQSAPSNLLTSSNYILNSHENSVDRKARALKDMKMKEPIEIKKASINDPIHSDSYPMALSPPEITERCSNPVTSTIPYSSKQKPLKKGKQGVLFPSHPTLVVKIHRKFLQGEFNIKNKRRKKPKRSPWAKKKSKVKPKVINTASHLLTVQTVPSLMVKIPLRILKIASRAQRSQAPKVLQNLPLSPKTPTFDKCFLKSLMAEEEDQSNRNFISQLFQGHLMYGTKCLECEQCTGKEESFLDLSIPIPVDSLMGAGPLNSRFIQLEECIEHFAASEFLSGDNKYFCEECNHLSEAERFIKLSFLPPILVLHINRFSHNSVFHFIPKYRSSSSKLCTSVGVPEQLCLEHWCMRKCPSRSCMYQLFAVVFHTGISVTSGHYTTAVHSRYCQSIINSSDNVCNNVVDHNELPDRVVDSPWFYFDDEKVNFLEHKHFTKLLRSPAKTPYILFYERTRNI